MILLVGIGLLILSALISNGNKNEYWKKYGDFKTREEYWAAVNCRPKDCSMAEHHYYEAKAWEEWKDPKWTDPKMVEYLSKSCNSLSEVGWIWGIAAKMEYDAGLVPYEYRLGGEIYDPVDYQKKWWRTGKFAYEKWLEEGIIY